MITHVILKLLELLYQFFYKGSKETAHGSLLLVLVYEVSQGAFDTQCASSPNANVHNTGVEIHGLGEHAGAKLSLVWSRVRQNISLPYKVNKMAPIKEPMIQSSQVSVR